MNGFDNKNKDTDGAKTKHNNSYYKEMVTYDKLYSIFIVKLVLIFFVFCVS